MSGEEDFVVGGKSAHDGVYQHELALQNLDLLDHCLSFFTRRRRRVVWLVDERTEDEDSVASGLLFAGSEKILLHVDAGVIAREVIRHIGEGAGGLGRLPTHTVEGDDAEVDRHAMVFGIFAVGGDVAENADVVLERVLTFVEFGEDAVHVTGVPFDFGVKAGFGIMDEVTAVLPLNDAFERKGDEQADGDRGEVKKEIAPAVHGFVGRVDVQQKGTSASGDWISVAK